MPESCSSSASSFGPDPGASAALDAGSVQQLPEADGRERRRHPRYACDGFAEVALPNGAMRFRGAIQNLSVSGCFVETEFRLERGTQVEVYFETRSLQFRVAGTAAAPQNKRGVGIAFQNLTPRRAAQIEELVAELKEIPENKNMPQE